MTMLTHPYRPSGRAHYSPETREAAPIARLATIKRLCLRALAVLMATGTLAAIIALYAAFYLSRLTHL